LVIDIIVQFAVCPAVALYVLGPMGDYLFAKTGVTVFPAAWQESIVALRLPVLIQVLLALYFMVIIPVMIRPLMTTWEASLAAKQRVVLQQMLADDKSTAPAHSAVLPYGTLGPGSVQESSDTDGLLGTDIDTSMAVC
jgi:hypothetical protein